MNFIHWIPQETQPFLFINIFRHLNKKKKYTFCLFQFQKTWTTRWCEWASFNVLDVVMGSGKSPDHTLQRCRLGDEWTLSRKLSDPFESGAETSVEPLQFPSKKLVDFTVIHMVICDQLNGAYIRMVHPFEIKTYKPYIFGNPKKMNSSIVHYFITFIKAII